MVQPRVGIVMPLGYQRGGAETLLMHFLRHGSRRFAIHCLFLQEGPMVDEARALGYPIDVVPATRLTDIPNLLNSLWRIRRWARTRQLHAVLSWMPKAHLYVAPALALSSTPLMWYQHGISSGQFMDRFASRLPAKVVLCCSGASQQAQDKLAPHRYSAVCYPGIAFPSIPLSASAARQQLGLETDIQLVGMVSRWERWKGVHTFLQAVARVAPQLPRTVFFIAGGAHARDPEYAREIEALAASLNLGSRLILAGQRPAEEVPLWLAASDLMVHPSIGTEPFGMAVAEAMAMGRTVVASNIGGIPEMIRDGEDGFLVPAGDIDELTATVLRLLRDPLLLAETGERALDRGRSFSIDRFASRVDDLISETIGNSATHDSYQPSS